MGPAGGVGELLSFVLLSWWFLAAGHGNLNFLVGLETGGVCIE